MKEREDKLTSIIKWAESNTDVRIMLITSSLVNPLANFDNLSDLDIELVFENSEKYILDKNWTLNFGTPIATIEDYLSKKTAIKMILYGDHIKVDFKLHNKVDFLKEINQEKLPYDLDIGYEILIDKEGISPSIPKPSYQASIIKKPSEKEFTDLIKDFWWDSTYVAKCLKRDEIFYAKFMSETIIRTEYLVRLIEWHIASENNWNITTNKHGRLFKKYLDLQMWTKIENTFSGSDIEEN